MKEYFPQVITLGGGICVKDINDPYRYYVLFNPTPEYDFKRYDWTDAMALEIHKQHLKEEIPEEEYVDEIRHTCYNKAQRAKFELLWYEYLIDETLLYFL